MAYIIPSIFRAIDNYSNPVRAMAATTMRFEERLHALGAGSERAFRRHTNIFSNTTAQMFDYAKSMAAVGAVVGGIVFSAKSISDYEDAVASFRTIVSDLNDVEFAAFKDEITRVAFAAKKSTVEVAQSFEKIAGLNAEFAKTAGGLGMVSQATITLAKASRMELGPAAESLVGIMNQFSFAADQADRTINALAAGQAVGAASISQTAAAMTNFGATAAGANVTLEQSIGLIQTMAKFGQIGENAGHRLRSALIKIQETGAGYKSGKFSITDALEEVRHKFDALATAKAKDAYLTKVFGLEQITTGRILVSNIELFKQFTEQVTGTQEAYLAARINTDTFIGRLDAMRAKWVNIITTSSGANIGLMAVSGTIGFLTDNMELIVGLAAPVLTFFALWKVGILAVRGAAWLATRATAALNFVQGIGTVITGRYATACFATTAGIRGMAVASFFLERGLLASFGIIGLVAGAILILANNYSYAEDKARFLRGELQLTKDGFVEMHKPVTEAAIALDLYTEALKKYGDEKRSQAYDQYMAKHQPFKYMVQNLFDWRKAIPGSDLKPTTPVAPKRADFPGLDTSAKNRPSLDSLEASFRAKDTTGSKPIIDSMRHASANIYLNVQVDKSGNVSVDSKNANISVHNSEPKIASSGTFKKEGYS